MSQSGKLCIVHNGIIENYAEIKQFLQEKGYHFISDTDTETAIQLIDYFFFKTKNLLQAVLHALHRIEGAYAMVILCADDPDTIIAARKDAPLLLGYGDGFNLVASDATALIAHTRKVAYMEDGEVAVVTPQSIEVFDILGQPVKKELHTIDWDISAAEKGGYPHFMLKEIMEEPKAIHKTVSPRIKDGRIDFGDLKLTSEQIQNADILYIIACGSSYHVGMVAKYTLEGLTHKLVLPVLASEFCYSDPLVTENTLVIIISQSGETHDTMEALKVAKQKGAHILSIVNVVGSSIARASDDVLYTWAGPEIAVATTKAYTTQLVLLDLLGLYLADILGTIRPEEYSAVLEELNWIPEKVESILQSTDQIKFLASRYFNHNSIFFIGRNIDYALCMEGSLKLKEISYIHSEAYAAGELKHGTISLIEDGTLVIALATYTPLFEKIRSNIVEVASRGAEVLALTTVSKTEDVSAVADHVISVPDTHPILQPSLGVVPLQLFAYYMALQRGCDIDKPRNLAKSVTVE